MTYKPDVADARKTPPIPVARWLGTKGAEISYHDPYMPEFTVDGVVVGRATDLPHALEGADLAVLLQDHACYGMTMLGRADCAVPDTRGRTAGARTSPL